MKMIHRLRVEHEHAQRGKCAYCRRKMKSPKRKSPTQDPDTSTLEHILPQKFGGVNSVECTIAACHLCNRERSHRPLSFWSLVNVLRVKPIKQWGQILTWHIQTKIMFKSDQDSTRPAFDHRNLEKQIEERRRARNRRIRQARRAREREKLALAA